MRTLFISVSGLFNTFDSILRQLNYDLVGKIVDSPENFIAVDNYLKSFSIFIPNIYDLVCVRIEPDETGKQLVVKEVVDQHDI